ncbi:MAG: fumarylacetoacetate hydrolase family protein [Candidatus Omnitrophota bacterium]|nr:MAG: fumarylacetoacetate hydrolase family protein [Candidatus Omnitrophota bacterium]
MKIVRLLYKKEELWGILKNNHINTVRNHPYQRIRLTSKQILFKKVKLLAPTIPTKIILAGLNYKDHARELKMKIPKEPVIFLKPPTTIVGHNEAIVYPEGVKRLDYEAELAVVIKKRARNISARNAKKYILGYTCLNDVTARDLQKKDGQWTRAKSFDTFCPIGPWVETDFNPEKANIKLYVNGKLKQDSCTSNFIFSVDYLVSFISKVMTLLPGDVISSGTPAGVGPLKKHNIVEVEIKGIGRLRNKII